MAAQIIVCQEFVGRRLESTVLIALDEYQSLGTYLGPFTHSVSSSVCLRE